ncbi:hypothetical protein SAMN05444392_11061 [Seinonella peptonophila]|uniref:Uncharacterized protein n=1 Tax=Seinonella peptonophila TaxID=112248 RepID=A0A1M4ZRB6_9BACL|nr:hypothetical protein SAMN05444392_11061 [Seinonella peptonophila]
MGIFSPPDLTEAVLVAVLVGGVVLTAQQLVDQMSCRDLLVGGSAVREPSNQIIERHVEDLLRGRRLLVRRVVGGHTDLPSLPMGVAKKMLLYLGLIPSQCF